MTKINEIPVAAYVICKKERSQFFHQSVPLIHINIYFVIVRRDSHVPTMLKLFVPVAGMQSKVPRCFEIKPFKKLLEHIFF